MFLYVVMSPEIDVVEFVGLPWSVGSERILNYMVSKVKCLLVHVHTSGAISMLEM